MRYISFQREYTIRFSHCDPAGIVFFPQYLVLFNHLVEDWFNDGLNVPYAPMVASRRIGMPTVHLECDFVAISRMGDGVLFELSVERVGTKSLSLAMAARVGDEVRVRAQQVFVFTNMDTHQSIAIPDDIRAAVSRSADSGS